MQVLPLHVVPTQSAFASHGSPDLPSAQNVAIPKAGPFTQLCGATQSASTSHRSRRVRASSRLVAFFLSWIDGHQAVSGRQSLRRRGQLAARSAPPKAATLSYATRDHQPNFNLQRCTRQRAVAAVGPRRRGLEFRSSEGQRHALACKRLDRACALVESMNFDLYALLILGQKQVVEGSSGRTTSPVSNRTSTSEGSARSRSRSASGRRDSTRGR